MNRLFRHILAHPYTAVTLVALTIMGIVAVGKHTSEWDETYVFAARTLLHGGDMYRDFIGYVYPPFSAWLMIPFTVFPPRLARAIWYVICDACLVYIVKSSWRMAGGSRLEPLVSETSNVESPLPSHLGPVLEYRASQKSAWNEPIAFLIAQACVLQLALNALTHLQPDLLIAALLMAGCAALIRGRYFVAATWIGLSGAFKVTPLLFVPYLLWRRRWVAAGWVVVVAVAVNLLPDTVHAPRGGGTWVGDWSRKVLAPMTRADYVPGNWANKVNNNQALSGAVKRWMATTWSVGKDEILVGPRPGAAGAGAMRDVFAVAGLAILIPVAIALWRRRRDDTTPDPALGPLDRKLRTAAHVGRNRMWNGVAADAPLFPQFEPLAFLHHVSAGILCCPFGGPAGSGSAVENSAGARGDLLDAVNSHSSALNDARRAGPAVGWRRDVLRAVPVVSLRARLKHARAVEDIRSFGTLMWRRNVKCRLKLSKTVSGETALSVFMWHISCLLQSMDINSRLYVEIHPFEGPHQPHPHPVHDGRFDPELVYKVLGMFNPSETGECYFILANPERQIWFIPQRHLLAYRIIDSDEFFLPKEADAARELKPPVNGFVSRS